MVEIIPQAKAGRPGWVNALLAAALVFLLAVALMPIFFGTSVGNIESEKEDVNRRIADLDTEANRMLVDEVEAYRVQLANFADNLARRHRISRVLILLEETVHPETIFDGFQISVKDGTVRAEMLSESYRAIGEQLLVFNRDARIKRVAASNYRRIEEGERAGSIVFNLVLDFDPAIIQ